MTDSWTFEEEQNRLFRLALDYARAEGIGFREAVDRLAALLMEPAQPEPRNPSNEGRSRD